MRTTCYSRSASRPFSTTASNLSAGRAALLYQTVNLSAWLFSPACFVMFDRPCSTDIIAISALRTAPGRFSGDVFGIEVVTLPAIPAHRCSGIWEWLLYRNRMWCFSREPWRRKSGASRFRGRRCSSNQAAEDCSGGKSSGLRAYVPPHQKRSGTGPCPPQYLVSLKNE